MENNSIDPKPQEEQIPPFRGLYRHVKISVKALDCIIVACIAVIVIVGLLSVVAVLLLIKSFQNARKKMEPAENVSSVPKLPKKKKETRLSNRTKVRQTYRSFLRAEQDMGMKLRSSDTSESVLQRIHKNTDPTCADDLRNVYLEARYDERQNISRKQVDQAKRALKASHKKK